MISFAIGFSIAFLSFLFGSIIGTIQTRRVYERMLKEERQRGKPYM
jgi:hypothetical protein